MPQPLATENSHIYLKLQLSTKQKGVLIAIRDSVSFYLLETHTDPEGRYLIVVGTFNNNPYTIVNLYAPNTNQLHFLKKLFCKVESVKRGSVIMCEDYNLTVDYEIEVTSPFIPPDTIHIPASI